MPKLTCVKCNIDLRPETNGVKVVELMNKDTEIYKIWHADLWKCPTCQVEIVGGFAQQPLFESFEGEGQIILDRLRSNGDKIIFCKEYIGTPLPRFGEYV